MADHDTIAAVYDVLVPDALLTPRGSAGAFAAHAAAGGRARPVGSQLRSNRRSFTDPGQGR